MITQRIVLFLNKAVYLILIFPLLINSCSVTNNLPSDIQFSQNWKNYIVDNSNFYLADSIVFEKRRGYFNFRTKLKRLVVPKGTSGNLIFLREINLLGCYYRFTGLHLLIFEPLDRKNGLYLIVLQFNNDKKATYNFFKKLN